MYNIHTYIYVHTYIIYTYNEYLIGIEPRGRGCNINGRGSVMQVGTEHRIHFSVKRN